MKKFALFLVCALFSLTAASQTYRYDVVPGSDNTYAITHKEIKSVTYGSSKGVAPFNEFTTYDFATLTGNMTLTVSTTDSYAGDQMTCLFKANGSVRTVTFGTNFSSNGTLVVPASGKASVNFVYTGSTWLEESRQTNSTGVFTDAITEKTSGSGITMNSATTFSSTATFLGAATFTTTSTFAVPVVQNATATTFTAAGSFTITAAQIAAGLLTAATSTATTTFTLPSTSSLATQFSAAAGTCVDFLVLNNGASNGTITVAVGTGMTASAFPGTNTLTLAGSATTGIARFRITFLSSSASTLARIN